MKNRKEVRQILADNDMDPIQALVDLLNDLRKDKKKFKLTLENITMDQLKREAINEGLEIDKVTLRVLQSLNDAAQKEDDQKIKLAELELKKQAEEQKRKALSGDNRRVVQEYIIPGYSKQVTNGKTNIIKLESEK